MSFADESGEGDNGSDTLRREEGVLNVQGEIVDPSSNGSVYNETDALTASLKNGGAGPEGISLPKYKSRKQRFHNQFFALFLKNMNLQKRSIFMNIFLILLPGFAILNVVGLQLFLRYETPMPDQDELRNPIANVTTNWAQHNPIPYADVTLSHLEFEDRLVSGFSIFGYPGDGFSSKGDLDRYIYEMFFKSRFNPIVSAIILKELNFTTENSAFSYVMYYNTTIGGAFGSDPHNNLVYVVQNYLAMGFIKGRLDFECSRNASLPFCTETANVAKILLGEKQFPVHKKKFDLDIVAILQIFFFSLMFHLLCPVVVAAVVYERENKLIALMQMMGLRTFAYYLVHYIFYYMIHVSMVVVLVACGWIFSLRLFTQTDLIHTFIFWGLWGHTLIGYSVFYSAFFGRSRPAFLLVFLLVFVLSIVSYVVNLTKWDMMLWVRAVLSLCPSFSFCTGIIILSFMTATGQSGVRVRDFGWPKVNNFEGQLVFLVVDGFYLFFLGLYLQAVLPKSYGIRRSPFFPLVSFVNFFRRRALSTAPQASFHSDGDGEGLPDDVNEERIRVMECEDEVQVHALNKRYSGSSKDAIRRLSLGIAKGECFGLLGPNGAGKSTLISILSGLYAPTNGTAFVGGFDVRKEMSKIHGIMGVCPQDNILWPDLTGSETLKFYGRIRGLHGSVLTKTVKELLVGVNLSHRGYRRMCVKHYSGGMKRRLSVAIALVGNPAIVFLDEPTTGMDPDAKRGVWDVITEASKDRAVVLTTHSMEEADALCRRIGIVTGGELQCIGEKTELKARFGKGYRFGIHIADGQDPAPARAFVDELFRGELSLLDRLGGNYVYEVPREVVDLAAVFRVVEEQKEVLNIDAWSISATTLDEVFVRITEQAKQGE